MVHQALQVVRGQAEVQVQVVVQVQEELVVVQEHLAQAEVQVRQVVLVQQVHRVLQWLLMVQQIMLLNSQGQQVLEIVRFMTMEQLLVLEQRHLQVITN